MCNISKIAREEIEKALALQVGAGGGTSAETHLENHAAMISCSLVGAQEEIAAVGTKQADQTPGELTLDRLEAGLPNRSGMT